MKLQRKLRKSYKGEITVYLCLIMTVIISLILAGVTTARGAVLQVMFECATESALCSVFGEYDRELLEEYDVFFIDMSYLSNSPDSLSLESRMNMYLEDNMKPQNGTNFLFASDFTDVTSTNVSLINYELATDFYGKPFRDQAIAYMKDLIELDELENVTDLIAVHDSYSLSSDSFNEEVDRFNDDFGEKRTEKWETATISNFDLAPIKIDLYICELANTEGIIPSNESVNLSECVSYRTSLDNLANVSYLIDPDPVNNLIFDEYIITKLSNYTDVKEKSKMAYATEYVIFGQAEDRQNMEDMLAALFGIRAMSNYVSLNMSDVKKEEVKIVAAIISVLTKVPEEVGAQLLLLTWACLEAVTDVRTLLNGGKTEVIKDAKDFNVSLNGLVSGQLFLTGNSEVGDDLPSSETDDSSNISFKLSYEDYIRIFLYLIPTGIRTLRTMDMIEQNLRFCLSGENHYFCFDACADQVEVTASVETGYDYRFITQKKYSF